MHIRLFHLKDTNNLVVGGNSKTKQNKNNKKTNHYISGGVNRIYTFKLLISQVKSMSILTQPIDKLKYHFCNKVTSHAYMRNISEGIGRIHFTYIIQN